MKEKIKKLIIVSAFICGTAIADSVSDVQQVISSKFGLDIELFSWLVFFNDYNIEIMSSEIQGNTGNYYRIMELEKRGYLFVLKDKNSPDNKPRYTLYPTEKAFPIISSIKGGSIWTPELVKKSIETAKSSGDYVQVTNQK